MESNGKSIVIACPSKYKLATIFYTIEGASMLENFTSTDVIPVKTGEIMTNYNVYVYPIKNGATVKFREVTLTLNNS